MSLEDPDDADMETDGAGMVGSHGYHRSRTTEFYPAVSPVTVAPALGFSRRLHPRRPSSEGGRQGRRPAGEVVTPERVPAVLKGDSPSSTKSGGSCVGGPGVGTGSGLGLTKHAIARMAEVDGSSLDADTADVSGPRAVVVQVTDNRDGDGGRVVPVLMDRSYRTIMN